MKQVFLSVMLMLMGIGMANAQKTYTYVQQNDMKLDKLGTAAFDLSKSPSVEFVDGKAVMTIGGNTVAMLPMSDGGQLVVEFETTMADSELNKVTKTYSNPFATLYSPFQLTVPEGTVEVYAPTYDSESNVLTCNSTTQMTAEGIIPVETGLLLKNAGTAIFGISADASTVTPASALMGSSLKIDVPTVEAGNTLYTLGHETNDASRYGFFTYTGSTLGAGLAYLIEPTVEGARKYVALNLGDETTGVDMLSPVNSQLRDGKYVESGRVVIMKNNRMFNVNGQELK